MKDQLRKFKTIVDDDRTTIKHLKQQRNAMKAERDETFALVTSLEKEHSAMIRKLQSKHRKQIDTLTAGFLQSLGMVAWDGISVDLRMQCRCTLLIDGCCCTQCWLVGAGLVCGFRSGS